MKAFLHSLPSSPGKWIALICVSAAAVFPQTPRTGQTWTSRSITSGSSMNNVRPIMPWPAPCQTNPHRMLFWMHGSYTHYTNYKTGIKYLKFPDPTVSLAGAVPHHGPDAGRPRLTVRDALGRWFQGSGEPGTLSGTNVPTSQSWSPIGAAGRK